MRQNTLPLSATSVDSVAAIAPPSSSAELLCCQPRHIFGPLIRPAGSGYCSPHASSSASAAALLHHHHLSLQRPCPPRTTVRQRLALKLVAAAAPRTSPRQPRIPQTRLETRSLRHNRQPQQQRFRFRATMRMGMSRCWAISGRHHWILHSEHQQWWSRSWRSIYCGEPLCRCPE